MRGVVGLDIGHSTVKCVACGEFGPSIKRVSFIFPSIAIPAVAIADDTEAERANLESVFIGGDSWFFGRTAKLQSVGNYATGLTNSWIESKEHGALFLGAIKKLKLMGMRDAEKSLFVLGLPTRQHKAGKNRLKQSLGRLAPGSEILVSPQPMGALQCDVLNENGTERDGRSLKSESVAVIDVGYFTTDFLLLQEGVWTEHGCDSTDGVKIAAEQLSKLLLSKEMPNGRKIDADLNECQEVLISGKILDHGKVCDVSTEVERAKTVLVSKVVDEADRLFSPVARKLTKILVAGGGAPLVFPALSKKWPHVEMVNDHRMAIADGYCRLGSGILLSREHMINRG